MCSTIYSFKNSLLIFYKNYDIIFIESYERNSFMDSLNEQVQCEELFCHIFSFVSFEEYEKFINEKEKS